MRFTIHELISDIGFGTEFAARHPERCLVREAVVALAVQFEGVEGFMILIYIVIQLKKLLGRKCLLATTRR